MTLAYYRQHAAEYAEATSGLLPHEALSRFAALLPPQASLLDAGCGSGRDSAWFRDRGFSVDAFDLCPELCEEARRRFDIPARVASILDLAATAEYDGVWASASLVHFDRDEVGCALRNLARALKPGAPFYFSLKSGQGQGLDSRGRFFRYWSDAEVEAILSQAAPQLILVERWSSSPSFDTQGAGFLNFIAKVHV
ncbi:MAG: hypothetical protein RL095_2640 [Verrucomicrobiota bacterium]|jgi:SAM-dependent methyltransferase